MFWVISLSRRFGVKTLGETRPSHQMPTRLSLRFTWRAYDEKHQLGRRGAKNTSGAPAAPPAGIRALLWEERVEFYSFRLFGLKLWGSKVQMSV